MKLLVIFASARFVAASCLRAGFQFQAIDFFADWDLQQYCDWEGQTEPGNTFQQVGGFEEFLDMVHFDDCDFAIVGGGMENRPELINRLSGQIPILGTSAAQLARLIDAGNDESAGKAIRLAGGKTPVTQVGLSRFDTRSQWLRKKLAGAGGGHVRFAEEKDCDQRSKDHVFQQKIEGENLSAVFVSGGKHPNQNCLLLGITRQLVGEVRLGAKQFAYCGSIGPVNGDHKYRRVIERVGQTISTEFEIPGVFGIDFVVNQNGVWPIDINPRIPSSAEIIELSENFSFAQQPQRPKSTSIVDLHLSACQGDWSKEPMNPILRPRHQTQVPGNLLGKAILFWRQPGEIVLDQAKFRRMFREYWNALDQPCPSRWLADIPRPGTVIGTGDPVLSLFVQGMSEEIVYERLLDYAAELESVLSR